MIAELVLAGLFGVIGLRSAVASLRDTETGRSLRNRALVAVHDAAKAGFWLALGAFFLGFALIDEPQGFRWFVLVPIAMAGVRLAAAAALSKG